MQKHNDAIIEMSGHTSLEKYTSHFIWKGSKGLPKVLLCERWVGRWTELQHIDPNSYGHNSVSFPFSWAAQPGAWGPNLSGTCSSFQHLLSNSLTSCSDSISHNRVQVLSIPVLLLTCSHNSGILNTCTQLWLIESEQATPVDSIKDVVRSSRMVPEFDKHLKKAGGHIGRNVVKVTITMKTIVRKGYIWKGILEKDSTKYRWLENPLPRYHVNT